MRIAMISDCYAPRLGGIETLVGELAAQFAARGDRVDVLTATVDDGGSDQQTPTPAGVNIVRITSRMPGNIPVAWRSTKRIAKQLQTLQPDVVIVHCGVISPFAYAGANAALGLALPTIVLWHCTLGKLGAAFMRASRLPRSWQHRGAVLAAVSSYAASWVEQAGVHGVRVLPNAIVAERWRHPAARAVAAELTTTNERCLQVASAIRLTRAKRPQDIIRIFARAERQARAALAAPAPVAKLTIFGSGPQLRALQTMVSRRQLSEVVHLAGRVGRETLAKRYHAADIYLTAHKKEAFGIAPLEARTAGLVVVGRAGTGMDDFIVSGESGLVGASDAQLCEQLTRLLTDRALFTRIRRHNLLQLPTAVWQRVLGRWDELIALAGS